MKSLPLAMRHIRQILRLQLRQAYELKYLEFGDVVHDALQFLVAGTSGVPRSGKKLKSGRGDRKKQRNESAEKGKRWKRKLVGAFSTAIPGARVSRGLQLRDGLEAPDVDIPGFWLEAKASSRVNLRQAMRQAAAHAKFGRWPLVVAKEDHASPVCVMHLSDFLAFYRQWYFSRVGVAHEQA